MSHQQLCHLVVTVRTRIVQRNQTTDKDRVQVKIRKFRHSATIVKLIQMKMIVPFIFSVHIGPMMQQVFHHSHTVVACSKMQRGGVAALQVTTVHVLRGAQLLWKIHKQIGVK